MASCSSGGAEGHCPGPRVVKEGLVYKRRENIRNLWPTRYFYLFEDGQFLGFKDCVVEGHPVLEVEPLNRFTVGEECRVMKVDRPKPFTFMMQGLLSPEHQGRSLERSFCTETEKDRREWVTAIEAVSQGLGGGGSSSSFLTVPSDFVHHSNNQDSPSSSPNRLGLPGEASSGRRKARKSKVTLENFTFLNLLGQGSFGKVVLCRDKKSQKLYAVKIMKKADLKKKEDVDHTLAENHVLQLASHPFILSLKCSFQTTERLFFVTEFVGGGELYFHLRKERRFSEDKTRFYGAEITCAIGYLHELGIIYRDLKLENLLLDRDGHIRIVDLGLCKVDMTYGKTTESFCGTPQYLAPEIIVDPAYGRAVDWWGLGVLMYEMMHGCLPFYTSAGKPDDVLDLIVLQPVRFPRKISPEAKDLLEGLLQKDPIERMGSGLDDAIEVMGHSFFSSIEWEDLVEKKIQPPFVPEVENETDLRYFDPDFVHKPFILTPPRPDSLEDEEEDDMSVQDEDAMGSHDQRFVDFSYRDLSSTLGSSARSMSAAFLVT